MVKRPALTRRKPKAVRKTKSEQYLINRKYLGDEPVFPNKKDSSDRITYMLGLNWYSYQANVDEAKEYLRDYLNAIGRVKDAKLISRIPDTKIPLWAAWTVRMMSRGYQPPEESMVLVQQKIEEALTKIEEIKQEETVAVPRVSIQERMKEKTHEILGEVEGLVDDAFGEGQESEEFNFYAWLQEHDIPVAYVSAIIQKLSPVLSELIEAFEGKDQQLKEGYRHLSKKDLKARIVFFNNMIEDADRYSQNTKKIRKPRKARPISKEKILKTFKYQKEDATFKLTSVNPEGIIGAVEVWTFNTKYKTITVLRALDRSGISVKGTSFTGYDENNSVTKRTGRKPGEHVKKILQGGKIVLRKALDGLKDAPLAIRSNENTIILRVVK